MKVRVGSGLLNTDTTATDITWSSESASPDAAIVIATWNTSEEGQIGGESVSIGITDFTTQASVSYAHEDGQTDRQSGFGHSPSYALSIHDDNSSNWDRQASVTAITGGVRLTPQASGTARAFIVIAFFGGQWYAFNENVTETTGNTIVKTHSLPGKPKFGFFGASDVYNSNGGLGGETGYGMMEDEGTIVQAAFLLDRVIGGSGSAGAMAELATDRCTGWKDGTGRGTTYEITANNSTSTTFTVRDANASGEALIGLLGYFTETVDLDIVDSPNTAASDWNVNQTTFTPQAVIGNVTRLPLTDTSYVDDNAGPNAIFGMADGDGSYSAGSRLNDGSNPAEADSFHSNTHVECADVSGFDNIYKWSNPTFTTDGFDVAAADIDDANGTTHKFMMMFIEEESAPAGGDVPVLSYQSRREQGRI